MFDGTGQQIFRRNAQKMCKTFDLCSSQYDGVFARFSYLLLLTKLRTSSCPVKCPRFQGTSVFYLRPRQRVTSRRRNFRGKLRKVARRSIRKIAPGKLSKQSTAVRHANEFSCSLSLSLTKTTPHFYRSQNSRARSDRFISLFACGFTGLFETISNFLR